MCEQFRTTYYGFVPLEETMKLFIVSEDDRGEGYSIEAACTEEAQAKELCGISSHYRYVEIEVNGIKPLLCDVTAFLQKAVQTDGAHHKQWYLEQIALSIGADLPAHDKGIAP